MKGGEDDQERRRQCWTSPQKHEANDVEGRSADSGKTKRRRMPG